MAIGCINGVVNRAVLKENNLSGCFAGTKKGGHNT